MPTLPPPPRDLAKTLSEQARPAFRRLETAVYESVEAGLKDWLNGSQFLTIKYGLIDAERALAQLSRLQPNWDSYGAPVPAADALRASEDALRFLAENQIIPTSIVPSAEGGVSLYFMRGERTAYIDCDNEDTQTLVLYGRELPTEVLDIGTDIQLDDVSSRLLDYLG